MKGTVPEAIHGPYGDTGSASCNASRLCVPEVRGPDIPKSETAHALPLSFRIWTWSSKIACAKDVEIK